MWTLGNYNRKGIKSASANRLIKSKNNFSPKKYLFPGESPKQKAKDSQGNLNLTPDTLTKNSDQESTSYIEKAYINKSSILADPSKKFLFRFKTRRNSPGIDKNQQNLNKLKNKILDKPVSTSHLKNCLFYIEQLITVPLAERNLSEIKIRRSTPVSHKKCYEKTPKKFKIAEIQTDHAKSTVKSSINTGDYKNFNMICDSLLDETYSFTPFIKPRYL